MPNEVVVVVKAKDQASKKLKGVGKQVDGIGSKLKGLGPIGGLAFGAMATMAAKSAFDGAMAFDAAFGQVRTLLPAANADALSTMRGQLLEFAKDFGEDSTIAAKSLYQAISAGATDTAEAFNVLETAAKSAAAANTDTATAVTLLSQVMNGYGRENITAEKAADILQQTIRFGMTTFEEMAGSLFQITGLSSSLSISFEQLGAMTATMTAKTGNTSVAVTQLKSLFTALSKGSSTLAKTIKAELGASFSTLSGEGMTVVDVLRRLAENRTDDAFRDLFTRVESLQGAQGLLGAASDGREFVTVLKEMAGAAGAVDVAYKAATDTTSFKFKKAMNEVKISMQEAILGWTGFLDFAAFALTRLARDGAVIGNAIGASVNAIDRLIRDDPLGRWMQSGIKYTSAIASATPAGALVRAFGGGQGDPFDREAFDRNESFNRLTEAIPFDWDEAFNRLTEAVLMDATEAPTTATIQSDLFKDLSKEQQDAALKFNKPQDYQALLRDMGLSSLSATRAKIVKDYDPIGDAIKAVALSMPKWGRAVGAGADTVDDLRHSITDFVHTMSEEVEGLPAAWGASAVHMEDQLSGLLADAQTAADNMATALELAATKGVDASDELERWQGELVSIQGEMATLTEGWAENIVAAIIEQTKVLERSEDTRIRIEAYDRALLGLVAHSIGSQLSAWDPFSGPIPMGGGLPTEAEMYARAEGVRSGRFKPTMKFDPDTGTALGGNEFFEKVKAEFERLKLSFHWEPGDLIPIGQGFAPDPTGPSRVITASGQVRGEGQTAEDYARERAEFGSYRGANITINVETLIGEPAEAVYGLLNQGNRDLGLQLLNSAVSDSDGL
jgi:TP901 family phage tail tape measure protein